MTTLKTSCRVLHGAARAERIRTKVDSTYASSFLRQTRRARDAKEGRRAALSANSLTMRENTGKSAFVFRHNSFEITERHVSLMAASQQLNALTRVATAMKSTCSRKERYVDKVGEHADRDLR